MQNLPGEYVNAMMNEIIAFEIREVSFEVKFKLNQNKPKEDILGVIENLMRNGLSNSPLVSWMEIINHKKLQNE
jgi:predicted FMN-binding regulatory protein PaiB